jgi:hypothetical protein
MEKQEYIILKVDSKFSLSDNNLLKMRDERLQLSRYKELKQSLVYNVNSDALVKLFIDFENGILMPDRCNTAEPIKDKFISYEYKTQVGWLSHPGGALYLKKSKSIKYECYIENMHLRMIWNSDGSMTTPVASDPEYLCEIKMFINKSSLNAGNKGVVIRFYNELVSILKSDKHSIEGI